MTESERKSVSEKYYQELRKQLDERIRNDNRLNALSKKIMKNTADFNDTAKYSELVSNHIAAVLQENIAEIAAPLAKEFVCTELLKDQHSAINETLGKVQVSVDEKKGIHISPQKAPFPFERVRQVAHALEDPTVEPETIRRRANAPVANVAKSFHDDYIKVNAKVRNDLGLKPVIQRYGANCCAWCSEVAGKYRFGEQPEGIFRRHDNCNCVIIYDTQVLRGKQTADGGRSKTWEEIGDVPADYQPTVFTPEQAKAIEQQNLQYSGLTNVENYGIINVGSEEMFRKLVPNKIEPMPKKQLRKIEKRFKANGGIIQYDDETDAYLESKHAEAITYNANTILLKQNPGRASVFEELIHTAQYRDGENDGSYPSRLKCEIAAQKKLIKNAGAYKLTKAEIEQTKKALYAYEKELAEYFRNGGT